MFTLSHKNAISVQLLRMVLLTDDISNIMCTHVYDLTPITCYYHQTTCLKNQQGHHVILHCTNKLTQQTLHNFRRSITMHHHISTPNDAPVM